MIADNERCGLPSASSLDSEIRCLGRRALVAKVAPEAESEFAKRGTKIHSYLSGEINLDNLPPSDRETATRIQAEEARLVEHYRFQDANRICERRLWVLDDNMKKLYSARVDVAYVMGKRALVCDFKCGFSATLPVPQNFQVKCQVACVAFNYGCEEIVGGLIHPHHPTSLSECMTFSKEKIAEIQTEIIGYLAAMTPEAPRTPNGISCQYCAARSVCKEYQAEVSAIIPANGQVVKASYEVMGPEERGRRLRIFSMAEKLMEEERKFYVEALQSDPAAVDGWRLQKSEMRVIDNDLDALEKLTAAIGIGKAMSCVTVSLKALETVLQESGTTKKDVPDKIAEILGDTLTKKSKKPSLKEVAT